MAGASIEEEAARWKREAMIHKGGRAPGRSPGRKPALSSVEMGQWVHRNWLLNTSRGAEERDALPVPAFAGRVRWVF
jgi:hypothetical protein